MPHKYLIVDNHPLYADAVLTTVRDFCPHAEVFIVRTIKDAKATIAKSGPFDFVLLELQLPDTNGFDGLMALRIQFPKQPIVVLSSCTSDRVRDKAIIYGATAYICKSADRETILEALEEAAAKDLPEPIDPDALLHDLPAKIIPYRNKSLTHQQLRVLQSICLGRQNKQIARELDIAETTIKAHVSEILRKLGVTSRTQAVLDVSRLEKSFYSKVIAAEPAMVRASPERVLA